MRALCFCIIVISYLLSFKYCLTGMCNLLVFKKKLLMLSYSKLHSKSCDYLYIYICINNSPLTLPQIFRTDANFKEWSSFISLKIFTSWFTKLWQSFFGTLTCLTPKKKCTYILHTISSVTMCHSWQFGWLQRNISCLLHNSQTSIQDEVQPLLPITITSLPSTQKHFDWAYTYIDICEIALHAWTCTIERDQWIITQRNSDN